MGQVQMFYFLQKVLEVKNGLSTSAFARELGLKQKTVDLYLKGERKPSVEFVVCICSKFGVSADWLLGLPERSSTTVTGNSGAVAIGHGARAKCTTQKIASDRCEACKFKRFAEAFQALQKQ